MNYPASPSPYDLLGVSETASSREIHEAFQDMLRIFHPDSRHYRDIIDDQPDEKHARILREIQNAYENLRGIPAENFSVAMLEDPASLILPASTVAKSGVIIGRGSYLEEAVSETQAENKHHEVAGEIPDRMLRGTPPSGTLTMDRAITYLVVGLSTGLIIGAVSLLALSRVFLT